MRKSSDILEEIKIKKSLVKKKKDKKLHASGHKTAFIYLKRGSWFLKERVVL